MTGVMWIETGAARRAASSRLLVGWLFRRRRSLQAKQVDVTVCASGPFPAVNAADEVIDPSREPGDLFLGRPALNHRLQGPSKGAEGSVPHMPDHRENM